MLNLIVGLFIGAIVMDLMWAWRLGLPQALWRRFANRDAVRDEADDIGI